MGMTWRFIMPLLSTLAALVIIVHSAEEDTERSSRYEIRPRVMDTRPSSYEQSWRVAEPVIQHTESADEWNNDPEEPTPVRRRPGRKRKRRPPADTSEEVTPQRRYANIDDETSVVNYETPVVNYETPDVNYETPVVNYETPVVRYKTPVDNYETTPNYSEEAPRRRRKKPKYRQNRYTDSPSTEDVPLRRRMNRRRKRPILNTWPRLSEFGGSFKDDDNTDAPLIRDNYEVKDIEEEVKDIDINKDNKYAIDDDYVEQKEIRLHNPRLHSNFARDDERYEETSTKPLEDSKSLSEFSVETMTADGKNNKSLEDPRVPKSIEKAPGMSDNAKDHAAIDPQTLKDLLKKSNGTSLSEILQQHNLTLADLLSGKENAISVLRSHELSQKSKNNDQKLLVERPIEMKPKLKNNIKTNYSNIRKTTKANEHSPSPNNETDKKKPDTVIMKEIVVNETAEINVKEENYLNQNLKKDTFVNTDHSRVESDVINLPKNTNSTPSILANRRFSGTVRRKLRMRPMLSNNYKSQLNRDLIALSARRYIHHNRRNATKAREWKDMIPLMPKINATEETNVTNETVMTTTISVPEETTTDDLDELMPVINIDTTLSDNADQDTTVTDGIEDVETTTLVLEISEEEMPSNFTERPKVTPIIRNVNASTLRRQAYNNRLKKKRLQQKTSTTEPPPNDVMKNFLSMGDFVSSSEFIARTQLPRFTNAADHRETVTELEDFMTTETTSITNSESKTRKPQTHRLSTKPATIVNDYPITTTTEETAKIEIEEILRDTHTSAKLSKILKERNMTLIELLEHRERGSSHVHLADIFHNASREPNPPEPFLTKSLIEPISKETYPLRALLDANLHDTTTRSATVDPSVPQTNHVTIPVTMAFGNNVNENAENMGIMSLFNNYTKDTEPSEKTVLQQDSEGTPYKSTIIHVNATDDDNDARESRMMSDDQDMVSWNEIFAMIRKRHNNESAEVENVNEEVPILTKQRKMTVETDADGDGLIVLEDLQHISEPDSKAISGSMEKVEYNSYESGETPHEQNILNSLPSNVKSVTVTTASLVGLAMILFLLTYSAIKWKQQRAVSRKNNFNDERIPSPVFENRKVKKNCSSRSISPMLPTSNIYTMNTLESQNGKESPEYMWDTLRKPFQ